MHRTVFEPPVYPMMAGGIVTNGADIESFLQGMLKYDPLPKTILDQIEADWTKPPVNLAPRGNYFGHYGWYCFDHRNINDFGVLLYVHCITVVRMLCFLPPCTACYMPDDSTMFISVVGLVSIRYGPHVGMLRLRCVR